MMGAAPQAGPSYYGQYTNPAPYQPYQAPAGQASINTGVNVTPPSLPPGALQSLLQIPQTNFAGAGKPSVNGGYNGQQAGDLNNLYQNALQGGNWNGAVGLQNLVNQQGANANMLLGQTQGNLAMQGMGLANNQLGFNLGQLLDYQNMLRGFGGSMFGNLLGMTGF